MGYLLAMSGGGVWWGGGAGGLATNAEVLKITED